MSNDVLTLALTVHERKKDVAVRFNRVAHLSPELSWVTLTIDGEKRRLQLREDDEFAYVKTFLKGEHTMTLDFGGVWPAGLVTLPEETTALTEILPVIADCATLEPLAAGSLTTPETPLTNLTSQAFLPGPTPLRQSPSHSFSRSFTRKTSRAFLRALASRKSPSSFFTVTPGQRTSPKASGGAENSQNSPDGFFPPTPMHSFLRGPLPKQDSRNCLKTSFRAQPKADGLPKPLSTRP